MADETAAPVKPQESAAVAAPEAPPAAAPTAAPASAPASTRPSGGPREGGRRRPGFAPRRKVCRFCAEHVRDVDYKQVQLLRTFTTETGRMLSARVTGNCARHQRQISRAVKRARNLALLPYIVY